MGQHLLCPPAIVDGVLVQVERPRCVDLVGCSVVNLVDESLESAGRASRLRVCKDQVLALGRWCHGFVSTVGYLILGQQC